MSAAGGSVGSWGQQLRADARRGPWRRLLTMLEDAGWRVLHDRRIPGARRANADHIIITPAARVYVVDSKLWSGKPGRAVHVRGGRLMHGTQDRSQSVRSLLFETGLVEKALEWPVQALMVVHNAPVARGRFVVEGIPVLPASMLVQALVLNDGVRDPRAVLLRERAEGLFLPYR